LTADDSVREGPVKAFALVCREEAVDVVVREGPVTARLPTRASDTDAVDEAVSDGPVVTNVL
jgi:hypothetical protein